MGPAGSFLLQLDSANANGLVGLSLGRERLHAELLVMPHLVARELEQRKDVVIASGGDERAQAVGRALEETALRRIRAPGHLHGAGEAVRPRRRELLRCAERTPVVAQRLEVRDLIVLVGDPEPLKPCLAGLLVRRSGGDDGGAHVDGVIHCGADRPRRTVDPLDCWRHALKEGDSSLGGQERLRLGDLLDLGHRLFHPRDRRLRLPAEPVATKAGLELPGVGVGLRLRPGRPCRHRRWSRGEGRAAIRCGRWPETWFLQSEISEYGTGMTQKRRGPKPHLAAGDVSGAIELLTAQGYSHQTVGRPRKGSRPLAPALAAQLGISARRARQLLARRRAPTGSAPTARASAVLRAARLQLERALGTKVDLVDDRGVGTVVVHFSGYAHLEGLMRQFGAL